MNEIKYEFVNCAKHFGNHVCLECEKDAQSREAELQTQNAKLRGVVERLRKGLEEIASWKKLKAKYPSGSVFVEMAVRALASLGDEGTSAEVLGEQ